MPRVRSTWLIGSIEDLATQNFTIDITASAVSTGSYYLFAADDTYSLIAQVYDALVAAGVVAPVVEVLENRMIRISAGANFAITWGSATQLRDLLGFDGDLSGDSSYDAESISPLLWSGGEVSRAVIDGVEGYPIEDVDIAVSADGQEQITTNYYTHTHDEWSWEAVHRSRYWSTANTGGTWMRFRTEVLVPGHRFHCYEQVEEDTSSTVEVTLPANTGVYKIRELPPGKGSRVAGFEASNVYWKVSMAVRISPEYS